MIYLFLSIACSVTVGVLLKLAKRYQINVMQAVTWNYLFAIALSFIFFRPHLSIVAAGFSQPVFILLGILLPVIFLVQAYAVQQAGLARTDIAQRLSLFISLCAAYFLFDEFFNSLKYAGLIVGFFAIILTLHRKANSELSSKYAWVQLLFVFIGFGVIDVLFKLVSQISSIPYTTSLFTIFCIAFVLSLVYILYLSIIKRRKLQLINFACGCILGFFNFGNILFYLKAHQSMSESPFIVFATMNIGIIVIGSLIGVIGFKEKLSKLNYIGLILAVIAVILITLSKVNII